MTTNTPPRPPKELAARGRALWRSVLTKYELEEHELALLMQACRTADRLDDIAAALVGQPLTVDNFRGDPVAHPLLNEQRQQSMTLARLLASLRIPTGDAEADGRPQRRGGARGTYGQRAAR
ncbi:hypothetical protein [Petropleomorpha daqingensis]|uniref:Phage terminase, small subunit, putative, P27 family n=1 Tax=Petropleomorpha daqingensis TaxID=2026353 RepID=A0A853CHE2_9ACTN|nr:hypothetical protein [Petropleomorpha daqingensis]NYJ06591.1 hypothetical protein [Petropleomorpha daqingensis]